MDGVNLNLNRSQARMNQPRLREEQPIPRRRSAPSETFSAGRARAARRGGRGLRKLRKGREGGGGRSPAAGSRRRSRSEAEAERGSAASISSSGRPLLDSSQHNTKGQSTLCIKPLRFCAFTRHFFRCCMTLISNTMRTCFILRIHVLPVRQLCCSPCDDDLHGGALVKPFIPHPSGDVCC